MKMMKLTIYAVCSLFLAVGLSSCKAGSFGVNRLSDNEKGTSEDGVDRDSDFQNISSLIASAMFMVPYDIADTDQYFDYLYTAKDATRCKGGAASNAECQDQLLELFAVDKGIKAAAYGQQFFVDSNASFLNKLQTRTEQYMLQNNIGYFQYFRADHAEQAAVTETMDQMTKQLGRSPLAEVTVVPTIHFNEGGEPKCFSYSVSIRKLDNATQAKIDIPSDGYKMSPVQNVENTKSLEVQNWGFSYAANGLPVDTMAQGFWHNRYLVADFSSPLEARQELFFGLLNRTFKNGLDITSGDYPEDKLGFECSDEAGNCGFMKGEDKPGPDRCRLFHSL